MDPPCSTVTGLRARSSLAAPDEYPVLATYLDVIGELLTSDAVFHDGLRRLSPPGPPARAESRRAS
ncbi:hypothetical protein ACQP1O_13060 [Nocardia sp. CA-151230]|uniref:hypothetical protein n=1 Tax=Nocardia sp. CA-151230 TaxID=3239982 RepID=UPI003D8B8D3C